MKCMQTNLHTLANIEKKNPCFSTLNFCMGFPSTYCIRESELMQVYKNTKHLLPEPEKDLRQVALELQLVSFTAHL